MKAIHISGVVFLLHLLTPLTYASGATTCPAQSPNKSRPQCGHHAVLHCCKLLGISTDMKAVMNLLPPKEQGHSLLEIKKALGSLGLEAEGIIESYSAVSSSAFPVIAHMKQGHFVVIERADEAFVWLLDGEGRRSISTSRKFQDQWDGKLLRVSRKSGDQQLPACSNSTKDVARIRFDTLFIDRGELPTSQDSATYEFKFRNLGKTPLLIERVRTSCGCLGSEKPNGPVLPGESGRITLKYTPGKEGAFIQQAYVHCNDPCLPIVELTAAGNTARRVTVDPPVLNFGQVILGHAKTITCVVHYLGDTPLAIQRADVNLKNARLDYNPVNAEQLEKLKQRRIQTRLEDNTYLIHLTYTPEELSEKKIGGKVELETNIKTFERITIPIEAKVVAPVWASPSVVYFGETKGDNKVQSTIELLSRDSEPFRVTSVNTNGSSLKCSYSTSVISDRIEVSVSGTHRNAMEATGRNLEINIETKSGRQLKLPLLMYALDSLHQK